MKNLVLYVALFVVFILLAPVAGWGQGWERVYDLGGYENGMKVIETQDGNFIVAALKNSGSPESQIFLLKIGPTGVLLWSKAHTFLNSIPMCLHERADGTLILISDGFNAVSQPTITYWRFSGSGDLLETKPLSLTVTQGSWVYDVEIQADTIWMAGRWDFNSHENPFIAKATLDGKVVWEKKLDYFPNISTIGLGETFEAIELGADGFWVLHRYDDNLSSWDKRRILKLSKAGNVMKEMPLNDSYVYHYDLKLLDSSLVVTGALNSHAFVRQMDFEGEIEKEITLMRPYVGDTPLLLKKHDGGLCYLILETSGASNYFDVVLVNFDHDLNWLWNKTYSRGVKNEAQDIIQTASGGFFIAGATSSFSLSDLYLIRTDSLGNSITNLIAGQVQWDQDKDCIEQPADPGLKNWIVTAASPTDTFYRSTAPDGSYALRVDTGHYTVRVRPLNSLWDTDCSVLDTVLVQMFDTIQHHFPVRATVDCPGMEVSTAVARLRPCFPANLQVWWCNNGTIAAEEAQIQVVLNEHMVYDSASLTPALVSGDTLWFDLDTVQPFECGNFFVRVLVDCDTALLGQTLCYTAHAYPDTTCLPPSEWSGAQVVTTGYCEGDSVRLVLRNIGSASTAQGLEYIIVEDNVIMLQAPFWLPPGDSIILKVKANGSTWRLIAQQEPGFPHGFFSTVALEGCHEGASFSTGFVNQFPSGDAAPWLDEECRVVTGSYDPNDKSAVPEGYGEQHFVMANTDLEYLIRFQNTGTDTAFRVVIRDQISPYLDPASVQPGAASHAYTWSLSGTGELVFTFDPIALPDSGANLTASQGFVQFRIAQQPNLPQNTRFENRAAIYFDFNAPVITNTVFHTIQPLFKPTSSVEPPVFAAGEKLKVWPNPANEVAYISFKDKALSPRKLSLYDLSGHLVSVAFSSENTVAVQRGGLPAGAYWLSVEQRDERTRGGVVVWQ